MKTIKYIGYFDFQDSEKERSYAVSASNKMEYIVSAINNAGFNVELVSVSPLISRRINFIHQEKINRTPHFKARFFSSIGGAGKFISALSILWQYINTFFYLLFHTKKNEPIIVYHSCGYYNAILLAKRIRKFKIILEVEEIYQDVSPMSKTVNKWEYDMFNMADAYIFPTELLDSRLNKSNKPSVIIYGTYQVEPQVVPKFDDGKIHVVYAGTFDSRKGGAAAAAAAAAYLPSDYHLHICGFGTSEDEKMILDVISKTNLISKAKVTYEGLIKGRKYIEFIQKCHIGLSTQEPSAAFNATSFPSKVLSYLANGLRVVSIRIAAITNSSIGSLLTYYDSQSPENIAKTIASVDLSSAYDSRIIIIKLSDQFISDIRSLINSFE